MNSNVECSLKGSYRVDLYSGRGADRKLVNIGEWFDNDITCTGLNFPYVYSFAECFRYLSLGINPVWGGDSSTGNVVRTGLRTPVTGFRVYDSINGTGFQSAQYIGWEGYEIGGPHNNTFIESPASACGSKFTDNGISLYRGWTIPTGAIENGTVCDSGLSIGSFMVSPGNGLNSTGRYAFSIADRQVDIPSGFTATISYQLSLNFSNFKNRTFFSGRNDGNGWFYTGNASTGTNGSENSLLSGWSNFSGIYRQILPGLQMVDSLGACIIPVWGDQMEPKYTHCKKLYFYMTPDNSQFAVNPLGIPALNTESGAYNSDGLMANYMKFATGGAFIHGQDEGTFPSDPNTWYYSGDASANSSQGASTSVVNASIPSNIRMEGLLSVKNYNEKLDIETYNYQTKAFVSPYLSSWPVSFATPGVSSFDFNNYPNYGQRAIFSTYLRTLPNSGLRSPTGTSGTSGNPVRSKSVSRTAFFSPIHSMGYNSRYASMVLGYLASPGAIGEMSFQPYIDFLFFDNSGRAANMYHYRQIPDIYLSERGSGVADVTFSITGAGGSLPSCITRIYNVKGFMGEGIDAGPSSPMGLDTLHPLFTNNINVNNVYYPSGFAFTGQSLSSSVPGNPNYGSYGWGAVYGVVANTGYYQAPLDTCLIDSTGWFGTGFSGFIGQSGIGVIPVTTGDYDKLFWPDKNSKIGLRISNVSYYMSGYGNYADSSDFYSSGTYQVINDVTYSGLSNGRISLQSLRDAQNYPVLFLVRASDGYTATAGSDSPGMSLGYLTFTGASSTSGILPIQTGDYNGYIMFSGFDTTNLGVSRALNKTYTNSTINALILSGANAYVATNAGLSESYYIGYSENNGYTCTPLTVMGGFKAVPSQWKKPSGSIHHVENFGGSGNRLLPNYGQPNNQSINTYYPTVGGSYPGMSMENGLQMFCSFVWSGA